MSPLYSYECPFCGAIQDKLYHIEDFPKTISCPCGKMAKKIIILGHGGIQGDEPVWLESAIKTLQPSCERPIQTRSEYKQYLKEKDIICKG